MQMVKVSTSKLSGEALDWAVAKCEGLLDASGRLSDEHCDSLSHNQDGDFTTDWAQGGPLLDKYTILVDRGLDSFLGWTNKFWWPEADGGTEHRSEYREEGGTYLQAAMRTLVRAKLGAEVEVPVQLVKLHQ